MKVGIDARSLEGHRGVTRYLRGLLGAFATRFPDDEWRVLVAGPRPAGRQDGVAEGVPAGVPAGVEVHRDGRPRRLLFAASALTGRPRLDRILGSDLDVFWAPAPAPLAVSAGTPFVMTVHDLSFEERPGDFTRYERVWHSAARPRHLARRADRLICVSAATREALLRLYEGDVDPDRVRVILPGVRAPAAVAGGCAGAGVGVGVGVDPGPAKTDTARPMFLAVGALEPRKAPELLCRAFARARADGLDGELVFAGDGRLAGRLAGAGVRVLGGVDDDELDRLYRAATALVMPSWLEGSGLPPLEAAARGVPSIVSDLPVFEEILGDAVVRFPTGDEIALAAALRRLADDPVTAHDIGRRAAAAVGSLTWEDAADRTRAVLAEAAGCP